MANCGVLVCNSVHLLLLDGRRSDIHAQDDVLDLALGQTSHVDIVLLSVVSQNQVLQLNLHMDPLLISQRWPNVMRLRDDTLIWSEDNLGALWVKMECPEDEDKSAEARETLD